MGRRIASPSIEGTQSRYAASCGAVKPAASIRLMAFFTLPVAPDGANGARFVAISAIGRDFVTNPRRTECKN
ncbi:protein of unknown function [uncultured Sphingopyxis sp.]|uniref:Uncharacterized protein n=1 Tax=uncultured Sphingopyxis sp. TaxID=310581 RepID=A0A1Y5PN70_9SPHN|nr:protein of unknown function [uncultured Sphingopyxis sp.]